MNGSSSCLFRQFVYLFDNLLVLTLVLEVDGESDGRSDDRSDACAPGYGLVEQVVIDFVSFPEEPCQPHYQKGDAYEEPIVFELFGTDHTAACIYQVVRHKVCIVDVSLIVIVGAGAYQHEDACADPEDGARARWRSGQ